MQEEKIDKTKEGRMQIYQAEEGEIVFDVDLQNETVWANQEQIASLFGIDRSVVNRHVRNIYKDGELMEEVTCAKNAQVRIEGGRKVVRKIAKYNLDMIISVGYRVNSKKATEFRIWATGLIKRYLVDGILVNEKRLENLSGAKLKKVEGMMRMIKRLLSQNMLSIGEASGLLEVIAAYAGSFQVLREYSEGHIVLSRGGRVRRNLDFSACLEFVKELKASLDEGDEFGALREGALSKVLKDLERESDIQIKAAELLYQIIKKRPFIDGNKRIAAFLFIVFLTLNDYQLTRDKDTKISDRALTALVLLIAESQEEEKELLISLVCKLLED